MSRGFAAHQLCRLREGALGVSASDGGSLLTATTPAGVLAFDTATRVRLRLCSGRQITSCARCTALPLPACGAWCAGPAVALWQPTSVATAPLPVQEQVASWALLDPARLTLVCPAACSAAQDVCHAVATAPAGGGAQTLLTWPFSQRLGSIEKLAARTELATPAQSVHIVLDSSAAPAAAAPAGRQALVVHQDGRVSVQPPAAHNGGAPAEPAGLARLVAARSEGGTLATLVCAGEESMVHLHTLHQVGLAVLTWLAEMWLWYLGWAVPCSCSAGRSGSRAWWRAASRPVGTVA